MPERPLAESETRQCLDCAVSFLFSTDEASYYRERGFRPPDRCPFCRASDRAARNVDFIRSMGRRDTALVSGGHGTYGGTSLPPRTALNVSRGGPDRSPTPRAFHPATCAACGKETTIPFVPRGDRAVYCRECFNLRRAL